MDRVSTFADDETVELIRKNCIAVGISLQEELKSQDTAGEFFRRIADQRPEPKHSKQGYYIVSPDGKLLRGWMYPRPDDGTMKRHLKEATASYQPPATVEPLDGTRVDRGIKRAMPEGAVGAEVRAKVFDAEWPAAAVDRFTVIRTAIGYDRLWILKDELGALSRGEMPDSLLERIVRFHLGDNSRCILQRWPAAAIREARAELKREGEGFVLDGSVVLEDGTRGYEAKLFGYVDARGGELRRFDLLARGKAWGRHNAVPFAPLGKFTLAVAFAASRPGESFETLPVWHYVDDYLQAKALRVAELRRK